MPEDASLDAFASTDEDAAQPTAVESEAAESETADSENANSDSDGLETTDSDTADSETDGSETGGSEAPSDDSAVAESSDDSPPTVEDTDPAVSTYRWSPEDGECADCGEATERRWRADGERGGALVCADCKEW
ncbi:hypothetical protein M0R88_08915 [Halorussus gelatinilyticus]|uniref:DUF7573 domain-containing protein n=1 Tax=Halorussus gelatinilyticus TaxID=2937524 RepID=A0A8U0IQA9_9EURY|nr:hypothetical protein [Halorussus gelatinilyticus]UPW02199.1 hypothetical protein M0R88_08915 [Halorussus gelatinilyticus]